MHISPVDLSVSYILASMSNTEGTHTSGSSGTKIDSFVSLSFSNFPVCRYSFDSINVPVLSAASYVPACLEQVIEG